MTAAVKPARAARTTLTLRYVTWRDVIAGRCDDWQMSIQRKAAMRWAGDDTGTMQSHFGADHWNSRVTERAVIKLPLLTSTPPRTTISLNAHRTAAQLYGWAWGEGVEAHKLDF